MADAFRGLTIRLGADARPLNSALNSIKNSASAAQKQLNTLNKALKFDPTNANLMQSKIDLMGDKAIHSARAFAKIKTAMKQAEEAAGGLAGKAGMTSERFKKLAESTTEAYAKTHKIRDELYSVDAQLEHVYDAVKRVYAAEQKLEVTDQKVVDHINKMKRAYGGTGNKAKQLTAEMQRLMTIASGRGVHKLFGLEKGDAQGLIAIVDRLRDSHKKLSAEQKMMNAVEGYRAMRAQAQAYEAEVRAAVAETARLKTEMYSLGSGGGIGKAVTQIKQLEGASDKAVEDARRMIAAYKAAPKSLDAATAKVRAVAAAEETLKQKTLAIKDALRQIRSEPALEGVEYDTKEAYVAAMRAEEEYTELGTKLALTTEKARELGKSLRNMRALGVDKTSEEFVKTRRAVQLAGSEVKVLKRQLASLESGHEVAALITRFHELKAAEADATIQARSLHTEVSKLRALSNLGKGMREFGFGMYASLTPAIMMAGRYAIQAAKDVDSAYRDMRKTVNGTEEQFEHLKDAAIEFSRTHVTSADTMLEIEAMGGQLGIQVDNLETFAHTVSNLDIATNMESDDIAESLGKMASVMDINVDEYENFGDALVRLGNNMPVMEGDIMNMTTRYMGMGKVVGMTADQMLGWSAASIATGQRAEAAGSSMQRFISKVETAVVKGDDQLEGFARVAGMTAEEFQKSFKEDASATLYEFIQGLGQIQREGGSVNQVLGELKFGNVRDKQLLEGLAQQAANAQGKVNLLADALEMSGDAYHGAATMMSDGSIEAAGDAMREAEKKSEGFSGEFAKMCNNAKALAVELGDASIPILKELGSVFQDLTSWVHDLPDGVKELAVKFGILLAAIGPLSVGLGTFFQTFERIRGGITGVQGLFVGLAGKLNAMNPSTQRAINANIGLQNALMGLSKTPVLLGLTALVAAIGAIGDAFRQQIEKQELFKKSTEGLADVTKRAVQLGSAEQKGLELTGTSANSAATSVDELVESTAKLVDAQNDRISSSEKDVGQLKTAMRIINKYANTDMSGNVAAQGEFRAAVELVNEKCGTQYKVIDAVNGVLADENGKVKGVVGAINEYIKKKEEQIRVDQLSQKMAEDSTQLDTALATLSEAQEALRQYEQDHGITDGKYANGVLDVSNEYKTLSDNVATAKSEVDALSDAYDKDTQALGAVIAVSDESTRSIENMAKQHSTLNALLSSDEMGDFSRGLQNAGMTLEEFNNVSQVQWQQVVEAWKSSGYDMGVALDTLGIKARSMGEQYKLEMKAVSGSTKGWKEAVKQTGMSSDELATALDGAGISATQFANLGSKAFGNLWRSANGDMDKVAQEIALLDAAGIDPKVISIDDEGVVRAQDQVIELEGDVARIGEREFKWNVDTGSFEEVKKVVEETTDEAEEGVEAEVSVTGEEAVADVKDDISAAQEAAAEGVDIEITAEDSASVDNFLKLIDELQSIGNIGVSTSISVDASGIDGALGSWESLKAAAAETVTADVVVSDNTDETISRLKAVNDYGLDSKSVNVSVTGGALSTLRDIKSELNDLDGKDATTYVTVVKRTKQEGETATGGIVPRHARGGMIPRHASGGAINGIATRATMTNIGWVGEAGAEAVFHMRNAGGAVVPLSNRRYVRPFARAVAGEMRPSGRNINVTVNLDYKAGEDGSRLALDLASKLETVLNMEA